MMTRRVSVLLIGLLVAASGCAAPARSSKMVAQVAAPAPVTLRKKIAVTIVTAAELIQPVHSTVETDQLRQAVERSLQSAGYLSASPTAAAILLEIALLSLENADMGATVTSRIRYTLTSRASGAPLFNEVVVAECSRYAFLSWGRLQHSTECSVRENIEAFLQKILLLRAAEVMA